MNDATISQNANGVLRALMAMRRETVESLAPAVEMDASTLYRRMAKNRPSSWKAGELYRLAEHFGVSVADLYEGRLSASVQDDANISWSLGDVLVAA